MSGKVNVDFGGWISKGFDLWKANILTLAIATLLAGLVGGISFGILSLAMAAGLIQLVLALHDNKQPKPGIGDLFQGFSYFVQTIILLVIFFAIFLVIGLLNIIPCIGWIAAFVLMIAVGTLSMFTMFYITDKKLPAMEALKASIALVKQNFFPLLGLQIVVGAISSAGSFLCGIGALLTVPMGICILTVAYRAIEGGGPQSEIKTPPSAPNAG